MSDDVKIMNRINQHLAKYKETYKNDWFVICLQGSQNYDLADEESDIDTKILTIPSLQDIILNKSPLNKVIIMENNEHCDVKDIREYFKIIRKQNINFVEILFTDYWIANPKYIDSWLSLRYRAEDIARGNIYRFLKCCKGMCLEKQHALCHAYPSKEDLIKTYGWDGKQLSHAYRVYDFATRFVRDRESYKNCLIPKNKEWLIEVKRNLFPSTVECAIDMMDNVCNKMIEFENECNKYKKDKFDEETSEFLDSILYNVITASLKQEIGGTD